MISKSARPILDKEHLEEEEMNPQIGADSGKYLVLQSVE